MLNAPESICFDKKGNLYISDAFNYRVRKINTSGIIVTFAGTGVLGSSGDYGLATNAQLDFPSGLVADDTGNIYIADYGGLANRVRKVDTFGIITTIAGNGTYTYSGDGIPATNAQISPGWLAIDSFANLYIADRTNERVYKIDIAGIIHNIVGDGIAGFGGDGGPATTAELYTPTGVSLDACGNLYIPEAGASSITDSGRNIRKVTYNPTCNPFHAGSLGITEISSSIIYIYPNPASSTITITSPNKLSQITISNLIGQTKYSQAYEAEKVEIDIANLPLGIYMVAIIDEEGNKTVKKIVKE
jgi:sugar lactone lactonase YvrE